MADMTRNSYDSPAYTSGDWKKPEGLKNLVTFILLLLFTFGIYYLYWVYKTTEYANRDETEPKHTPIAQLLLVLFIPYYQIYWFWKTSKKIDHLNAEVGRATDNSIINLILPIFGLDFIAAIILQDSINKYACQSSGANVTATDQGVCKKCGATFPNDAQQCPKCGEAYKKPFTKGIAFPIIIGVVGLLAIAGIIAGIVVASFNAVDEETWNEVVSEYDLDDSEATDEDIEIPDFEADQALLAEATVKQTEDGRWALMAQDRVLTSVCGIASNEYGTWYIWEGYVDFSYTGPYEDADGNVYSIENGKVVEAAA